MNLIKFYSLWVIIFLAMGCSSTKKIQTLKPQATTVNSELFYESPSSFIHIPVHIQLKDIATFVNSIYENEVYVDDSFEDDQVTMTVLKKAPIQILNQNGKIKTILPLKAQIFYRFGFEKFGIDLYDTREFAMDATITLLSDVALSNWEMKTKTTLVSIVWHQEPTIKILGKNRAITHLINPALGLFQNVLEQRLDQSIATSMDFKPYVLEALEQICQPFQMSETYDSWLRIVPIELYTTNAQLKNESVEFTMGMKAVMESIIGKKPQPLFDKESIQLKPVTYIPKAVHAQIVAISLFEDASRLMTKNFKGEEFGTGNRKVRVVNVEIWQYQQKMVIALTLTGSVDGTVYLTGYPQYNTVTQEVYFDQLEYVLDSKNVLAKTAQWFASNAIMLQLQESCRYSIASKLDEGKNTLIKYLYNYSPLAGVYVQGKLDGIDFQDIQLTSQAIIAVIKVNGNVSISINGLN